MKRLTLFVCLLALLTLAFGLTAQATLQPRAVKSGNWSDTLTWSTNKVPTGTNSVTICGNFTVTVDINNAICTSLHLGDNALADSGFGILVFSPSSQLTTNNTFTWGTGIAADSGTVDMTNGGKLALGGNVTVTAAQAHLYAGTGTIEFSVGDVTLTSVAPYNNVTLYKGAANTLTLANDMIVGGILTLEQGYISTGSYKVDVTNTDPGAVAATDGIINGTIRRAFNGTDATGTYIFNDASTYYTANGTNPTSAMFQSFPNTFPTYGNGPTSYATKRYYTITTTGGSGSRTLSLSVRNGTYGLDVDERNGYSSLNLRLWEGNGAVWTSMGGTAYASVTNPPSSDAVSLSISSFSGVTNPPKTRAASGMIGSSSDWTMSGGTGLPIELASLTASAVVNNVSLKWSTVSETNTMGFYVERSSSKTGPFTAVSSLIAGAGTSLEQHNYSYTDNSVSSGTYYYRLHEVDKNGAGSYSSVITVTVSGVSGVGDKRPLPTEFALQQNYPNPFNPMTVVSYQLPVGSYVTLKVYNMLGQEVATLVNGMQEAGYKSVELDASNMPSGLYIYRLTAGTYTSVRKMVLIK
ncbi:MAG: T9SS type A sorting domain-containing protein [Bacteroidota bacterium]